MINDFDSLFSAISDELARADLAPAIPTWIQLAEADINRTLRVRQMRVNVSGTAAGRVITLPADYRQIIALHVTIGGLQTEIYPREPATLGANYSATGAPVGYLVANNSILTLDGAGNAAYTLVYYAALPPLTSGPNWLILREPGLYLYSALAHSAPYLKDDARVQLWAGLAKAIRDGMEIEHDQATYSNTPALRPAIHRTP